MRKECEQPLKAGQPALIVTYGNTTRKHRPLDRDLLLLGRAPACDVGLASPEVAPVHCIIVRTAAGWRIRDCSGGRSATRVNGRPIHEEKLHDGDVLQVGTFSFEVHLPTRRATPLVGGTPIVDERMMTRLKRLQRSRRNLVRLALKMRKRVRKNSPVPPTLAELERQAERLRGLQRDYEALVKEYESRLDDLEQAEHEVCDARAVLERESNERRTRLEQAEHDMARGQVEEESRLKVRWEECQERCRQAEQAHARFLQAMPMPADATVARELAVLLDRRSDELNHFARYLRRSRQQLLEQSSTPRPSDPEPAPRRDESEPWREQCQDLQAELTALDERMREGQAELTAECDRVRVEADEAALKVQELQAVRESLQREVHDRDAVLEKLHRQLEEQAAQVNLEHSGSYERELNAFRIELERDRQELNEQFCQLQMRQADMEAAARESELQMSRERAVIARERAELTRLRDEIRISKERATREGSVRERLSRLHHLKQELAKSRSPSAPGDQRRE